jgi:aldose sugar dehydrogenase
LLSILLFLSFTVVGGIYFSFSFAVHYRGLMFGDTTPTINDPYLQVEEVLHGLNLPTHIAFLNSNDILVVEKNNGTVSRIVNGTFSDRPLLDVNVANERERGMEGIAVSKGFNGT